MKTIRRLAAVVVCGCISISFSFAAHADEPAPEPVRVHIVEGMWSQHQKLPEALLALPGRFKVTESTLSSRYGFVCALKGFPLQKEELFKNQVLILANIPADAFPREGSWSNMHEVQGRSVDWVEEFVRAGGGVFVLGGNYSLGTGGKIKGTAFEKFLPADVHENDIDFKMQNVPVQLVPVGQHAILQGLSWQQKPITLFYHDVKPRPDATVVIKAGDAPIMILGHYGKGKVALFTATLHGDPAKGLVPHWEWESWKRLVQNTVGWLAAK
ncbi:MAG: glutamine amidotransferase [Armatimonadota bacterium]|nr:glutamine amidotransferase [Armatimonadota bacterium]